MARAARALRFTGKLAIHPEQIGPILDAFTPDDGEIRRAGRSSTDMIGRDGRAVGVEEADDRRPGSTGAPARCSPRAGAFAPPSSPEPPE